jgi:hypothetical protein
MSETETENGEEAEEVVLPAQLKPIVFGPPSHGSQDPNTAGYTLLPIEDLPQMQVVTDEPPEGEEGVGQQMTMAQAVEGVSKDDLLEIADLEQLSEEEVNGDMEKGAIADIVLSNGNLNKLTKDELATVADTLGMEDVTTAMTKADMIAAIRSGGASGSEMLNVPTNSLDTPGPTERDVNPNA